MTTGEQVLGALLIFAIGTAVLLSIALHDMQQIIDARNSELTRLKKVNEVLEAKLEQAMDGVRDREKIIHERDIVVGKWRKAQEDLAQHARDRSNDGRMNDRERIAHAAKVVELESLIETLNTSSGYWKEQHDRLRADLLERLGGVAIEGDESDE